MRSFVVAALTAAFALAPLSTPVGAQSVTISPPAGSQDQPFVVAGEGLPGGLALDVNFVSPSGEVFSTAALNKVVVVEPSGAFSFEVLPSSDFAGQPAGNWLVQVCVAGMDQCVQTDVNIAE